MRSHGITRLLLVVVATLSVTGCLYAGIAAGGVVSKAIGNVALAGIGGDFNFDSVTWKRTPADTNTLTVRGRLTWNKSRTGASNTPYWDISGGTSGVSAELVDSSGRTMTAVNGTLTVWDGKERITMVPNGKVVSFELRTSQLSPNLLRVVGSVKMVGVVVKTM